MQIYELLRSDSRKATISRVTKETSINIELDLDGTGKSSIATGISFFDHMLDQLSKHGQMDLNISVDGDLEVLPQALDEPDHFLGPLAERSIHVAWKSDDDFR